MALSSINPENQKCPYVGCEHKGAIPAISGDVHRCSHCNRLALKCEKPDCEALNRPFSRFCRRCGDDMSRPDYGKTVSSQWLESRRFSEPFPDFVFGRAEIQKFGRELEPGILAIIASLRNESQMTSRLRIAIRSSLWAKPESVQLRFDVVESQDLRSEESEWDFEQKLTEALRKDLATPFVTIAQQIANYILLKLREKQSLSDTTTGIENAVVEDLFRHTHNLRLYFLRYLIERGPLGTQPAGDSPAGPDESVQEMVEMLRSQPKRLATIISDTLNNQRSDLLVEISKYLVKELEENPRLLIERLHDRSSDHQDSQDCTPAEEIAETLATELKRQPPHLARFLEVDIAVLPQLRKPESLLEVQFLDGLLAIHQAGSYQGIYHPFASNETAKILQLRDRPELSPDRRPWKPTLIDRRFIVFSHPEFARSVDAWSLTGWSVRGNAETHDLFHCPAEARLTLAAAPVPFEGLTVGLLFYDAEEESYLWLTLDISQSKLLNSDEIRDSGSSLKTISGTPCEVDRSMDQAITFSTSSGHWVWKTEDARNSRTEKMERLITMGAPKTDDGLVRSFHFPRQKLFLHSMDSAETEHFNWYYQTTEGPETLQCCRVYFSTLHAEHVGPLRRKMIPLGKRRTAIGEMVIIEDGKVWSESFGRLAPRAENLTIEKDFIGLTFEDPLLLTIGSRLSSQTRIRRLTIRSIENLNHSLSFEVNPPYSNPILWGRWLFTTEYDTEGEIVLRRRILSSPD